MNFQMRVDLELARLRESGALDAIWRDHLQKGGVNVAQKVGNRFVNVEIKGHIDTDEKLELHQLIEIETPYGAMCMAEVIHRKAQPGNPMGKWKYLVQYHSPVFAK